MDKGKLSSASNQNRWGKGKGAKRLGTHSHLSWGRSEGRASSSVLLGQEGSALLL